MTEYFHADFYAFDPERVVWTEITDLLSGPRIPGRCGHGFAAAGGMIYVYGGSGEVGETRLALIETTAGPFFSQITN